MVLLSELRLRAVRARMAEVVMGANAPEMLGRIRLQRHQRLAVSRVTRALRQHGGCLLADDVGRGKTFVALAVARSWQHPLLVVPASLRRTWQQAIERAAIPCAMITHEALSRGASPAMQPDGIVVDESHRFRSPSSRRHAELAAIAAHVPVLLLSATPLQNGTRDLAAQLALFLGSSAFECDEASLARHVVRGLATDDTSLPSVAPPLWVHPAGDDGMVLREILALPPPARAIDAGDAGALRTIGLLRAWGSSRAALVAAIQRRRRIAAALEQCAADGLAPSRRELRAWHTVGPDVQLTLAPLLVARTANASADEILAAIAHERDSLARVSAALARAADPDVARAAALRALREEHAGARILAFSEFASTVRAYYALLRADRGVGMLTATEARIASGRLSRDELLDRFAPIAQGAARRGPQESVTLLFTTDLLSEGVNLQDASIVVHLDLPWNPARLAQRLGRVRRPGGATMVRSFLMAPPAGTELLLRVERRLRAKLAHAERTVGKAPLVLPPLAATSAGELQAHLAPIAASWNRDASAEAAGLMLDQVASWRRGDCRYGGRVGRRPLVAAVASDASGWLAVLDDGRLLARHGDATADIASVTARAVTQAMGVGRPCGCLEGDSALAQAREWLAHQRLVRDCGVVPHAAPLQEALERRIAAILRHVPRHERPRAVALAARLRDALRRAPSLGAERELEQLLAAHAHAELASMDWLERSCAVATRRAVSLASSHDPHVVALVVFGRGESAQCNDQRPMRPFGPTAHPVSSRENTRLLYGTASTHVQVAPPSRETSVPVSPTAAIRRPRALGTNATPER